MKMTMNVAARPTANVASAVALNGKGQGRASGSEFVATMNQIMNQDAVPAETSGASIGLPSINGLNQPTDSNSDQLMQLLDSLLADMEQAEQLLKESPELMALLQQWLQQAQAVTSATPSDTNLGPVISSDRIADATSGVDIHLQSEMMQLTAEPDVLAILIRDQLEQLRETIQHSMQQGSGKPTNLSDEGKLLESLQMLLNRSQLANGTSDRASLQQAVTQLFNDSVDSKNAIQTTASAASEQSQNEAMSKHGKSADIQLSTVNTTSAASNEGSFASVLSDTPSEVMTAGQLAIRADGLNSSKPAPVIKAQNFAQEMGNYMTKHMFISARNGIAEAKITLYPENLGQVDVRLTMQNGQLVASFVTEHAMAKDLLDQQMSMLRGALQSQGIQVEKLSVTQQSMVTNPDSLNSAMYQGDQRSSNGNGKNSSSQRSTDSSQHDGDLESIEDIRADLLRERMTGSSFEASI